MKRAAIARGVPKDIGLSLKDSVVIMPQVLTMISAIGVRNVVENKVDLTKSRNLIIAGVIFVCGLGFGDGLTFTIGGTSITLTALAIAAIAGILLNAILPGNDYEFGKNPAGDSSRGVYVMNTDSEKEESEDNK